MRYVWIVCVGISCRRCYAEASARHLKFDSVQTFENENEKIGKQKYCVIFGLPVTVFNCCSLCMCILVIQFRYWQLRFNVSWTDSHFFSSSFCMLLFNQNKCETFNEMFTRTKNEEKESKWEWMRERESKCIFMILSKHMVYVRQCIYACVADSNEN